MLGSLNVFPLRLNENGEKLPESVDAVRFKLYIRNVRTRLYSCFSKY